MTLYAELSMKPRRVKSKSRPVRPMGPWEIFRPDPDIRREEMERLHHAIGNRRRYGKA